QAAVAAFNTVFLTMARREGAPEKRWERERQTISLWLRSAGEQEQALPGDVVLLHRFCEGLLRVRNRLAGQLEQLREERNAVLAAGRTSSRRLSGPGSARWLAE